MAEKLFFMKEFGDFDIDKNSSKKSNLFNGKCLLPAHYSKCAEKILNATVRKDDVWLVSYPRSGSTWCQEIIWLITNNLDFQTAQTTMQQLRAPIIETSSALLFEYVDCVKIEGLDIPVPRYTELKTPLNLLPESLTAVKAKLGEVFGNTLCFVESQPSPRCMRSHLSPELLPKGIESLKPKIIYTMRNPKDLCVSYYFYLRSVHKFQIKFDYFCELFMRDALPFGSLFHHYLSFWNKRHEPNVLVLKYEEMVSNPRKAVKKIASHLNKSLNDEDVDAICEFLTFKNMKENKACNLQVLVNTNQGNDTNNKDDTHFIRKGKVGDYNNYMSKEMIEKFDKWIEENTIGADLSF